MIPDVYVFVVLFLGLGSMWFHGSLTGWGGIVDAVSMYLFTAFLIAFAAYRLHPKLKLFWILFCPHRSCGSSPRDAESARLLGGSHRRTGRHLYCARASHLAHTRTSAGSTSLVRGTLVVCSRGIDLCSHRFGSFRKQEVAYATPQRSGSRTRSHGIPSQGSPQSFCSTTGVKSRKWSHGGRMP